MRQTCESLEEAISAVLDSGPSLLGEELVPLVQGLFPGATEAEVLKFVGDKVSNGVFKIASVQDGKLNDCLVAPSSYAGEPVGPLNAIKLAWLNPGRPLPPEVRSQLRAVPRG